MDQKQGFFNLFKNLVINLYWIYDILKIYIICCYPTQIPYLGKFSEEKFLRQAKMLSTNQIAGFF